MPTNRRQFLGRVAALTPLTSVLARTQAPAPLHLSCNEYTWSVYFGRDNRRFGEHLDTDLAEVAASGLDGFEPSGASVEQITRMGRNLDDRKLEMRSLYVNSELHDPVRAEESIRAVLRIAGAAKALGTRIVVTNPSPLRWGGPENKSDQQLEVQARNLNTLGRELAALGLKLAYHNHDIEIRAAAREFHHMMLGTDPDHVHLCLDAHWVYRGAGNSAVALFDIVRLYAARIVELHVRQSQDGVWTEIFSPRGDVDYPRLVADLVDRNVRPLVVLEQAIESGSPKTLNALEAHRRSVAEARKVFAPLAG